MHIESSGGNESLEPAEGEIPTQFELRPLNEKAQILRNFARAAALGDTRENLTCLDTHEVTFNEETGWAIFTNKEPGIEDGITSQWLAIPAPDDEGRHMIVYTMRFTSLDVTKDGPISDSGFTRYYPLSDEPGYVTEYDFDGAGVYVNDANVDAQLTHDQLDDETFFDFGVQPTIKGHPEVWPAVTKRDVSVLGRMIDPMIDWRVPNPDA